MHLQQIESCSPLLKATVYTHLSLDPKILHFAPQAPQYWGELYPQSPPELGDLGGENDLYLYRSLLKGGWGRSECVASSKEIGRSQQDN